MVTLSAVAGIPIEVNDELEKLTYDPSQVKCVCEDKVRLNELIPILLNKSLKYPNVVYSHHRHIKMCEDEVSWPDSCRYDLFSIPSGLLGIEYTKTHIFYAPNGTVKAACVIQVFHGELTILLQKNMPKRDIYDMEVRVEDAMLVNVQTGEKVVVPAGYYYTFINTSGRNVVFARVITNEHVVNYEFLRGLNGLACYLISKNAREEMVTNPRYKLESEVKRVSVDELNDKMSAPVSKNRPLYRDVVQQVQVLSELLG